MLISLISVIVAIFSRNIFLYVSTTAIWYFIVVEVLLQCNKIVFFRAMRSFDFVYKSINIAIGWTGLEIINKWYQSHFVGIDMIYLQMAGIFVISGNVLVITLVSLIFDGYKGFSVGNQLCFTSLIIANAVWHGFVAYTSTNEAAVHLFGSTIYWRSIALVSLFNVVVFMLKQVYFGVFKPNKLTIVQSYIDIKIRNYNPINYNKHNVCDHVRPSLSSTINNTQTIHNFNYNYNYNHNNLSSSLRSESSLPSFVATFPIDYNSTSTSPNLLSANTRTSIITDVNRIDKCDTSTIGCITVDVNKQESLFYILFSNITCTCINVVKLSKTLHSNYCICGLSLIFISGICIENFSNYHLNPEFSTFISAICFVLLILIVFNINYKLLKYSLVSNFLVYWRLFDAVMLYLCMTVIDKHYKARNWEVQNYPLYQSYIVAILEILMVFLSTIAASLARSYLIHKWIKLGLVFFAIFYWAKTGFEYYLNSDKDVLIYVLNSKYYFSMRSTIASKTADLVVWFVVELVALVYNSDKIKIGDTKVVWD